MFRKSDRYLVLVAAIVLMSLAAGIVSAATVTQSITYQGKLTNAAGSPLSGTYTITFRLYDVSIGGTALETLIQDVSVTNGVFTTSLAFNPAYYDGRALWLGIKAGADPEMTPRQEIRPVPYALGLRPGTAINVTGLQMALYLSKYDDTYGGLYVDTYGKYNAGVRSITHGGSSSAFSAETLGVSDTGYEAVVHYADSDGVSVRTEGGTSTGYRATIQGDNSAGVFVNSSGLNSPGISTKTWGLNSPGVLAESVLGKGVFAKSSSDVGVWGESPAWVGVYGNGSLYGLEGISSGTGVYGESKSAGSGVYGRSASGNGVDGNSNTGSGVYGSSTSGPGVSGWSVSGYGVKGSSTNNAGIYGESPQGQGVVGSGTIGLAGYGSISGVDGESTSGYGVHGYSSGSNGVAGSSSSGYGVEGRSQTGTGVYGSGKEGAYFTTNQGGAYSHDYVAAVNISTVHNSNPGIVINTSGYDSPGIIISSTKNSTGVRVYNWMGRGIWVTSDWSSGVYASSIRSNGVEAYTDNANHEWGVYTNDYIYAAGIRAPDVDLAEYMPVMENATPGTVLVIGDDGRLRPSAAAYDSRVAGIVSTTPAITLGRKADGNDGEGIVAIAGRVPCRVDATKRPVHAGDLLTTSDTPGYAMKAEPITVSGRTFYPSGIVLGKAMGTLESGTGTIEVLVTLQ